MSIREDGAEVKKKGAAFGCTLVLLNVILAVEDE
jgi:hypothetical protein